MRALPGAAAVALIVACSPSAPPAAPSSEPEVLVVPVGMRAAPAAPDLATEAAPEPPPAPLATEPLVFGQPRHFGEPHPDAETTPSGLRHLRITAGEGQRHPGPRDRVEVHYEGWTTDGVAFDSSLERGRPSDFGLHQVIAGWTEGVQLMVVGETTRFWIPEDLAYGGRPGKPAGMLVFDVE
ncbi:MAG: FKBP-type peptidyl-prolyl cis-trans isomerase, partial [Myxococcales bacterium]|nr:FKBP-type peptidyl-prolyl cis-trans isomerase [Myxococcales bacterium]